VAAAADQLHRVALDIGDVPRAGLIAATKAVKRVAQVEGGTVTLWRKRSKSRRTVRLRAVDKIRDTGDGANARVQALPVGVWAFLDGGAGAHLIPKARRRKGPPPRLAFGGRVVTGPVRHPGWSGDRRWRTVVARAERIVPDVFEDAVRKALR
jgi:hypothetical protein